MQVERRQLRERRSHEQPLGITTRKRWRQRHAQLVEQSGLRELAVQRRSAFGEDAARAPCAQFRDCSREVDRVVARDDDVADTIRKRLKENEEYMWKLADDTIDEFIDRGECELLQDYAIPFTLMVIAALTLVLVQTPFIAVLLHLTPLHVDDWAQALAGSTAVALLTLVFRGDSAACAL